MYAQKGHEITGYKAKSMYIVLIYHANVKIALTELRFHCQDWEPGPAPALFIKIVHENMQFVKGAELVSENKYSFAKRQQVST